MKTVNLFKTLLVVFLFLVVIGACKKDQDFKQISAFEMNIHNAINNHREGLNLPIMIFQFNWADSVQHYSAKMAKESVPFGIESFSSALLDIQNQFSGDRSAVWVTYSIENVDTVMSIILKDNVIKSKIEGDYTNSAVGTAKDINGNFYITQVLVHIPEK